MTAPPSWPSAVAHGQPTAGAGQVPGRGRRPSRSVVALGVAALAVALAGGLVAGLSHGSGASSPLIPADAPRAAADAYYAALVRNDAPAAFELLCTVQRQSGLASYAALVARNERTGTGITTWRSGRTSATRGAEADVPGDIRLDNGSATPITVTLLREPMGWKVCGSNLGGILPPAGGTGTGGGGQTT